MVLAKKYASDILRRAYRSCGCGRISVAYFLLLLNLFACYVRYMKRRMSSVMNTAEHPLIATVMRLFSKYAVMSAAASPTEADTTDDVAEKMAGTVITARTEYGM